MWGIFLRAVLEQFEYVRKLKEMAHYDMLTGVLNRQGFYEEVNPVLNAIKAKRNGSFNRLSVIFIDLDRFKKVNDTYGHDAGDRFLSAFAGHLKEAVRETDKVSRIGGDEFAIALFNIGAEGAKEAAKKLQDRLSNHPFTIVRRGRLIKIPLAASLGIYSTEEEVFELEELLDRADKIMFNNKRGEEKKGKNR